MSLLEVKNLTVAFRQDSKSTPCVNDVSFSVDRGETVALVGESGSGKSVSALSTVSLLPGSASVGGSVTFAGQELIGASKQKLRDVRGNDISFIFQEPMTSLNPLHTLEKQIRESLELHQGLEGDATRGRIVELLNLVGIRNPETRLQDYPHQLSGGQRQRVMIAMALANKPDILIADEPTTALDVTIQAQILDLLARIKRDEGMGLLFITHDLGTVEKIADRVYVMQHGEIVETGPTAELFANPQHDYTRKLLSARPSGSPSPVQDEAPRLVETENLKVWFPVQRGLLKRTVGHIKAVNDATLSVRAGETLGVVGESGSGKTTLAMAIMRLTASKGRITFDGEDVNGWSTRQLRRRRADMQIVFQDPFGSLSPRMTCEQIIAEGMGVHGNPDGRPARDLVAEVMEEVGLDPATMDRYPHEFSGGQRQRICIARALASGPRLIVCDEPTSALDVSVQAQVLNLMSDLKDEFGLTYLFISHDLTVVRHMADKVGVLYLGQLVEEAPRNELFDNPLHPYTRMLLDAAPKLDGFDRTQDLPEGEIPDPINPPPGCVFHPRCPIATDQCKSQRPEMRKLGSTRVACHLAQ